MGIAKISGVNASTLVGAGGVGGGWGAGGAVGGGSITYTMTPVSTTSDEGAYIVFDVTTTDMHDGTKIPYVITGVASSDINVPLSDYFTITNNACQLNILVVADNQTEGTESLTMTSMGQSSVIVITDTSAAPTGSPYTKSLYLDGTNDSIEVTTSDNDFADFAGLDAIFENNVAAWSIEKDFRIHGDGTQTEVFMYDKISGGTITTYYLYMQLNGTNLLMYIMITPNSGAGGSMGQWVYQAQATDHFPNVTAVDMWHRLSVTKNTGTSIDNSTFSTYINGVKMTAGSWRWGATNIPTVTQTNTTSRKLILARAGNDVTFGSIAFYNKELTQSEIWANYDGGAIESGAPDATQIMNINPQTTSTASNLIQYWYYDPNSDSNELIQDKVSGNLQARLSNTTFSAVESVTTPQLALLTGTVIPAAVYANEPVSIYQSGNNIRWYSNAGATTLLATGNTYTYTPASVGSTTIYVQSNDNGAYQIIPVNFDVNLKGYSTHSYDNGAERYTFTSPDLGYNNFVNGSFSMTFWAQQYALHNSWLSILINDNYNRVQMHGNTSNSYWNIQVNGVNHYCNFSVPTNAGLPGKDAWIMRTFSWNCTTGAFKVYHNGALAGTYTHTDLQQPVGDVPNMMKTKFDYRFGKIANMGIYNDALTDAEAFEIMGGAGNITAPGDTLDLRTLSSQAKLHEYWPINGDVFNNNSSDVLTGVVGGINIPVSNSNPSSKSTDRP